ncbi:peptidase inhibitor family I36 [Micromonospora pisi]|uniref:Peptidase inhibitor family I36 n=1 Tax=Micromonospora pisi TaxID=589240 RepID=A0A495JI28_9ACTN|nr:peptidase inhibitor family I36 [Micromonospora pisi]
MSIKVIVRFVCVWVLSIPLLAVGTPASATPEGPTRGVATFQGTVIDLKDGWWGAQSCVVWAGRRAECFATHEEADVLLGYSRQADALYQEGARSSGGAGSLAVPACASGWLCLYEHANGGGRRLIFSDEYWHYLSEWGFDRQTSSWRNNQGSADVGHLSLYNSGSVYNCGSRSYANSMGSANDQAYAVWG